MATRKRGHAYSGQRSERPLTWRAFLPFRLSPNRLRVACAGTGRNVLSCALVRMQRRRKVRTWTFTRSDDFGFHQDPQQDGVECLGISGRRSPKDFYDITLFIPSAVIGHIPYAAYAASNAHLPGVRACLPSRPVDFKLFADQASAMCTSYNAAPRSNSTLSPC